MGDEYGRPTMAGKNSSAFPTGLVILALIGGAVLFGYVLLAPGRPQPADASAESAAANGGGLEFEFYDRLQRDDVETNPLLNEPAEPGAAAISRLIDQLAPPEPSPARAQLENATGALEEIAQTIVSGLESRAPEPVAAPEPVPPAPVEPGQPGETMLAAPERETIQQAAADPVPESASAPGSQPSAAAPRAGGAFLQSGAYSQRERAQLELQRQRGLGLDVEITQRQGREGPLFLIQSGPYAASEQLEEAELVFRLHNIDTMRRRPP